MSYLVDSDWLIDAFVGVPTAVQLLAGLGGDGLAVSIISYGELLRGARRSRSHRAACSPEVCAEVA